MPNLTRTDGELYRRGGAAKFGPFQPINTNLFTQIGPRYNAQDQSALRLSALYEPLSNLTWNVSFEYFRDRGTPSANLMENPRSGEPFWSGLFDVAPSSRATATRCAAASTTPINDDISVAYIAGYNWFNGSSDFDQDSGTHIPQFWADPATTFRMTAPTTNTISATATKSICNRSDITPSIGPSASTTKAKRTISVSTFRS